MIESTGQTRDAFTWSVMIPAYNPDENYLEQTLQSVLKQDQGSDKMQIEVVDDCSPNGKTEEMVRKVAGDRIAVHRESRNLGLNGIWNRCIERAKGQYIHILHQDDLVFPGFYDALEKGLREHPDAGAAFCRHAYSDENGHWRTLSRLERPEPGILPNLIETLATKDCIQCASIVVKKTTYERIGGFSRELKHALDWEMWIRIANSFPMFYEPRILACWRQHGNATTSRQMVTGENTRDIAKAVGIWSRYLPVSEAERLSKVSLRLHAIGALKLAEYLGRQGSVEGYRNQIVSALVCEPSLAIRWRAMLLRIKFFFRPLVRWALGRSSALA
jgi:glycosyltransferase involved in cell wall biosynthesis